MDNDIKTEPIITTAKEEFSYEDSADMAWLIYRRFGRDLVSATHAWRRMMQNNCTETSFGELVGFSRLNDEA